MIKEPTDGPIGDYVDWHSKREEQRANKKKRTTAGNKGSDRSLNLIPLVILPITAEPYPRK